MLTATYSLVALAAEHDNARGILSRLRQYIETSWKGLQNVDFGFLNSAFDKLMQFDKYCRERKIELYLIPAMRNASREAEALIAELDLLSAKAGAVLRWVGEQLRAALDMGRLKVNELCDAMESYCRYLTTRLDKEEKELLPLAHRVLTVEDWFSIAAQFLADSNASVRKRHAAWPAHERPSQFSVNSR
jgi:hemerythrin-like domain-containing protein